ncbi:MAG TPA: hypothetical protein VHA06_14570 [Candidatus Angelobacter sp.]|jgi:hypothetical protein|nr:hypothetical protein [Candidatus Angelobacter sp.]
MAAFIWIALQNVGGAQSKPANDCASPGSALPQGASRVYIALRNGNDGSGSSMADARDGSTVAAFDTILRCYSEGCANNPRPIAKTENLTVCLGSGTFSTLGNYDFIINVVHSNPAGFTLGKGWKIHGAGKDKTTIKLSDYLLITDPKDPRNFPVDTGVNVVFSTNSDGASGVEISDLTIDGNYPELKSRSRGHGVKALGLEAIHLRSDLGKNWIHDVNAINLSTEIGAINERWEAFPVWIIAWDRSKPGQNRGNLIENVSMTQAFGTVCTAIAVGNAIAEVRNNLVDGYQIGYGGWDLSETVFHDNTAINTDYGFNIDSLVNHDVRIKNNKIIHPRKYGFVVGGGGIYANFKFINNTIQIDRSGVAGFIFQGNVTGAIVAGNKILADNSSGAHAIAIQTKSGTNSNNTYESNQIANGMAFAFDAPAQKSQSCFSGNLDERGNPRRDLPDNHNGPCVSAGQR